MKDKSLEAYKRAKFGEEFVKDTARGEYEQRRAASEADAYARATWWRPRSGRPWPTASSRT